MNTKIKQLKVKGVTYDIDVAKDWDQNDPSAVDFIKNKTHGKNIKTTYTNISDINYHLYSSGDPVTFYFTESRPINPAFSYTAGKLYKIENADISKITSLADITVVEDSEISKSSSSTAYKTLALGTRRYIEEPYWYCDDFNGKLVVIVYEPNTQILSDFFPDSGDGGAYYWANIEEPGLYVTDKISLIDVPITETEFIKLDRQYLPEDVAYEADLQTIRENLGNVELSLGESISNNTEWVKQEAKEYTDSAVSNIDTTKDWEQTDETAGDYIKNRTHGKQADVITGDLYIGEDYSKEFISVSTNFNYNGEYNFYFDLVRVFDEEYDLEKFTCSKIEYDGSERSTWMMKGTNYKIFYNVKNPPSHYDGDLLCNGMAILTNGPVRVSLSSEFGNPAGIVYLQTELSIPSKGLWITRDATVKNVNLVKYSYKQLDEKYIPDTIARNTEVERLVNSLGNLAHDDRYEGEGEDSFKSNNTTQSISKNSFSSGYATIAGAHCFKFAEHDYTQTTTTRIEKVELDDCCKSYLAEQPEEHVAIKSLSPEGFRALVADSQDSGTFTCPYCGNTYEVVYHNTDPGCWSYTNNDEYDLVTISIRSDGSIPMFFYLDGELVDGEELYYEAINRLDEIPVDYDTSTKTGWYYLTSVEGITVDMKYTIVLDNNYDLRGVVLAVDPENNRIQASNYIIPNSSTATTIDEDSYILFPYYPEIGTDTIGTGALAEGFETKALAIASHTEGYATIAAGKYSHAEGRRTIATYSSHAEGWLTEAIGQGSHAEGYKAVSLGDGSHAEGYRTIASGARSHSEGYDTVSSGADSHAEGYLTTSAGDRSHAEGQSTTAEGVYSHSEGRETKALGESSHAEGTKTMASGSNTHAEGYQTNATGDRSHSEGRASTASGSNSHAEGYQTTASGSNSHAEGTTTTASANGSHAEGFTTVASKDYSHAEGYFTTSSGQASHAEGRYTAATSSGAHAEGYQTTASRENSHAEGQSTTIIPAEILGKGNDYILNYWKTNKTLIARGVASHAEGIDTAALGDGSHSEGKETLSRYIGAHSEGISTRAVANAAHSEGTDTRASSANQHAQGRYNIEDTSGKYAHILGNGTSDKRSNAHTIDWDGNAWFAGAVSASSMKIGNADVLTHDDLVPSDWNQNDENASDYVKNRTHYESTILGPSTLSIEDSAEEFTGDSNDYHIYCSMPDEYKYLYDHNDYYVEFWMSKLNIKLDVHSELNVLGISGETYSLKSSSTTEIRKEQDNNYTLYYACDYRRSEPDEEGGYDARTRISDGVIIATDEPCTVRLRCGYSNPAGYWEGLVEINIPSAGIWISRGITATLKPTVKYVCHQLDEKYIPDTIARVDHYNKYDKDSFSANDTAKAISAKSAAFGFNTQATGPASFAEGEGTIASGKHQHVQGRYNIEDTANKYAHIIGNGTDDENRSNIYTVDWNGNAQFAGDVTVGEGKEKLVTETELKASLDKFEPSPSFIASAEAPANTSILWIDTSENGGLKYHNGTDWVTVPVRFS